MHLDIIHRIMELKEQGYTLEFHHTSPDSLEQMGSYVLAQGDQELRYDVFPAINFPDRAVNGDLYTHFQHADQGPHGDHITGSKPPEECPRSGQWTQCWGERIYDASWSGPTDRTIPAFGEVSLEFIDRMVEAHQHIYGEMLEESNKRRAEIAERANQEIKLEDQAASQLRIEVDVSLEEDEVTMSVEDLISLMGTKQEGENE